MNRLISVLLCIFGLSGVAYASVAFDAVTVQTTNSSATITTTHTPVGTPSGVAVVIGWIDTGSQTISSVTYAGASLTQKGSTQTSATNHFWKTAIFGSTSTPTSGAQTCAITFSGALSHGGSIACITVTGGASTALSGSGGASGANDTPGGTISGTASGELAIDVMSSNIGWASFGSGQTQTLNTSPTSANVAGSYKTSGGSTETMGEVLNNAFGEWAWSGASFADSGGGGCTPDHLTYTAQPSNAQLGATLGTITIAIKDSGTTTCTSATNTITLSKTSMTCAGMTLNGTVSGAAIAGEFTTTNVTLTAATGSCTLDAMAGGLTGATSSSVTISCTASKVIFSDQPANAALGSTLGTIAVSIQNSSSNTCPAATNTVTLSKTSMTCTGMTLNGTVSGAATAGVFTTTDVNMTVATGSCTLDANASGLTGATSSSFTINSPVMVTGSNDLMMFQ